MPDCRRDLTRSRYAFALLSLVLLWGSLSPAFGQGAWQRTAQVIVPVEEETAVQALVDSAASLVEQQSIQVRSAPGSERVPLQTLEDRLSEEGLTVTSATHLFVTYRFSMDRQRVEREISDLHFIYRPAAGQEEDIPLLYLDLSDSRLHTQLLKKRGTPVPSNEAVFVPFLDQIAFHNLQDEATIVRLGNQIIRDEERAAAAKENLMATLKTLYYN